MVWISQQDVQKPAVKPFVGVVAVEMCVDLEGESPREMLRRGSGRRDEPAAGPGSLQQRGDGEIAASTPTTITLVASVLSQKFGPYLSPPPLDGGGLGWGGKQQMPDTHSPSPTPPPVKGGGISEANF